MARTYHNRIPQKKFPKWSPFTHVQGESGYTRPPQNSKDHRILLDKEAVDLFKSLKDFQVVIYIRSCFCTYTAKEDYSRDPVR